MSSLHCIKRLFRQMRPKPIVWAADSEAVQGFELLSSLPCFPDGLLACGHALTFDPQDEQLPFVGPEFTSQWCSRRYALEACELSRLQQLAP